MSSLDAEMRPPDVQYARNGEVAIAYQVVGEGPIDIVFARGFAGELLSMWEHPLPKRHVTGLAELGRVLMVDKRGTGLSDRFREVGTLETRMDDLRAVMDAVGSRRAVFFAAHESARLAILFAATYPERTAGLAMLEPWISGTRTETYPWAPTEEEWSARLTDLRSRWGQRELFAELVAEWAPEVADDEEFVDWFVTHMRRSMSPGAALSFFRTMRASDVSDILPAVRVPTVVLHGPATRDAAMYVTEHVRHGTRVELPRLRGTYTWIDDETHYATLAAVGSFVEEVSSSRRTDRVLATVLFTDIADSTARAATLGDRAWRDLLERHHAHVRRRIAEFRGEELDAVGDGFLVTFDGPGRAIACASAIKSDLADLGLSLRAGIHIGECERIEDKLSGIAVHVGARIVATAHPGEVLVSSTVKDLVAGSGIEFDDRGQHELKGVPGSMHLFSVTAGHA
jgi:class 3 adenylate cyclase